MEFLRKASSRSGRSTPRAAAERSRSGPQRQKSAATFTWNGEQSLGSLNALPVAPSPPPEKGSMQGLFASVVTAAARENKATAHLARRNSFGGAAMRTHESDLPRFQRVFFLLFKEWLPCLFPLALAATHLRFWELFQGGPAIFFAIALLFQYPRPRRPPRPLPLVSRTRTPGSRPTPPPSLTRRRATAVPRAASPFPHTRARTRGVSLYHQPRLPKSVTGSRSSLWGTSGDERTGCRAFAQVQPAHTRTPSAARPAPTLASPFFPKPMISGSSPKGDAPGFRRTARHAPRRWKRASPNRWTHERPRRTPSAATASERARETPAAPRRSRDRPQVRCPRAV